MLPEYAEKVMGVSIFMGIGHSVRATSARIIGGDGYEQSMNIEPDIGRANKYPNLSLCI
jgi:hypothetical protein